MQGVRSIAVDVYGRRPKRILQNGPRNKGRLSSSGLDREGKKNDGVRRRNAKIFVFAAVRRDQTDPV